MLFIHFRKTPKLFESDALTAILMGALMFWCASIVFLVIISLTGENALLVLPSILMSLAFPWSCSVAGIMRDARFGMNRR